MGIHGLTSFIDDNLDLLADHKLHNTRVIIDGNNLYHFLYYNSHVQYLYAGDYDTFERQTELFFKALSICGIKPYVIFDGGYEINDRKLKTTLRRASQRIHLSDLIQSGQLRAKILPILTYETFLNVLLKLEIPHATCDFEADSEIASLANAWECPVISNDSDFFVFNIAGGYIPFDYLDTQVHHEPSGETYLAVRIYFVESFQQSFKSVKWNFLPVIAALLGNDYTDPLVFSKFLAKIGKQRAKSKHKKDCSKRHERVTSVLTWLESEDSLDEAISHILQHINDEEKENVRSTLNSCIQDYTTFSSSLEGYFDDRSVHSVASNLNTFHGKPFPQWFVEKFRQSKFPTFFVNTTLLHRNILLSQIEDVREPSAYKCSQSLRQILYTILLAPKGIQDIEIKSQMESKSVCIEEYDRVGHNQSSSLIALCTTLPSGGQIPSLEEIKDLSLEKRGQIYLEALQCCSSAVGIVPLLYRTIVPVIVFWLKNSVPKIGIQHLYGLIVSIIKLSVLSRIEKKNEDDIVGFEMVGGNRLRFADIEFDIKECKMAHARLQKFSGQQKHCGRNKFDASRLHPYAQFQTCLLSSIYLNKLLIFPFPSINPAVIYNGSFIYSFVRDLQYRVNPELFINEMLGRQSGLAKLFHLLVSTVMEQVPKDCFQDDVSMKSKTSKRGRTNKSNMQIVNSSTIESEVNTVRQITGKSKARVMIACDVSNKFAGLNFDDSSDDSEAEY